VTTVCDNTAVQSAICIPCVAAQNFVIVTVLCWTLIDWLAVLAGHCQGIFRPFAAGDRIK